VIKDTQRRMELEQRNRKWRSRGKEKEDKIDWIERLFNKPISNFREYCTTFIFIPYFINIRGLSHSETKRLTMDWLSRCNSLSRLHFDAKWKVNYQVNRVEGYKNTSCFRLEERNKPLYLLLKKEGII